MEHRGLKGAFVNIVEFAKLRCLGDALGGRLTQLRVGELRRALIFGACSRTLLLELRPRMGLLPSLKMRLGLRPRLGQRLWPG